MCDSCLLFFLSKKDWICILQKEQELSWAITISALHSRSLKWEKELGSTSYVARPFAEYLPVCNLLDGQLDKPAILSIQLNSPQPSPPYFILRRMINVLFVANRWSWQKRKWKYFHLHFCSKIVRTCTPYYSSRIGLSHGQCKLYWYTFLLAQGLEDKKSRKKSHISGAMDFNPHNF